MSSEIEDAIKEKYGRAASLCGFLDLSQQIVRKRHTCHGSANFQAAVRASGTLPASVFSYYVHVN